MSCRVFGEEVHEARQERSYGRWMDERGGLFVPQYGKEMEHVCDVQDVLLSKNSSRARFLDDSGISHNLETCRFEAAVLHAFLALLVRNPVGLLATGLFPLVSFGQLSGRHLSQ